MSKWNDISYVTLMLTCNFGNLQDVKPYTISQWHKLNRLLEESQLSAKDLFDVHLAEVRNRIRLADIEVERISRLLSQNVQASIQLAQYEDMGISLVTYDMSEYPPHVKSKLDMQAPPVF